MNLIESLYDRYKEGNFLISPYSLKLALGMARLGARGKTREEMDLVLGADPPIIDDPSLSIANRIWMRLRSKLQPDWLDTIQTKYNGDAKDILNDPTPEATINKWVNAHTKGKIPVLLSPGSLTSDDLIILTNAIHFKDDWMYQFKGKYTQKDDFYISETDTVKVDMMQLRGHDDRRLRYAETHDLQILELPYVGMKLSMVVLLPKSRTGTVPVDVISKIGMIMTYNARPKIVDVYFPKIKMKGSYSIGRDLVEMGMPTAFSNQANFRGMSSQELVKINKVIHKTFVDINEEGTEAAAATGVVFARLASALPKPEERIIFRADHPYVFLIRDIRTNTILFMGGINHPELLS